MDIIILLYKGFTALDVVGPYDVLSRLPQANVRFAAIEKGLVQSEYVPLRMEATHALAEVKHSDLFVVPGATSGFIEAAENKDLLREINRLHQTTVYTMSVCSGALLLAACGLLENKRATTHWAALPLLRRYGAIPVSERYIRQGKIVTAAGVSAGIDAALYLAKLVAGEEYAKMLQLVIEYYPEPPVNIPPSAAVPKEIEKSAKRFLQKDILKGSSNLFAFA
jgi:transcriptional regulator GlxA family with amidase domain